MALDTDFLDLYAALGLKPGCSLDAFQHAYRRRVSALHPDRHERGFEETEAARELQELTARYRAAMQFHRRHGRLPGGPTHSHGTAESIAPSHSTRIIRSEPDKRPGKKRAGAGVLLVLVCVIIVALWKQPAEPSDDSSSPAQSKPVETREVMATPAINQDLRLGLSERNVRRIVGEPDMIEGNRWDYGPSWILFENGKVTDWYSSPLRPLHAPSATPVEGRP